jgi:hypothetical protein
VIGMSSVAEALRTPQSDVGIPVRGRRDSADHKPDSVPMTGDISLRSRVPGNRAPRDAVLNP